MGMVCRSESQLRRLKRRLTQAPIFSYSDPAQEYILNTDASDFRIGAAGSRRREDQEMVVAYYSKTLTPRNTTIVSRRGLLEVVRAVKHYCPYLYEQKLKIARTIPLSSCYAGKQNPPVKCLVGWRCFQNLHILSNIDPGKGTA